ncbi:DNA repair protein RadA [uncultured Gammaproteobacteria bacterium]|jgi:DNA repair protein RadA/Sms|nr:DNA repair protein RadA [Bathymodiolus brooksi thiotrophic gill symbiont]CAC9548156.1 DNA repair protein RadA [uncultured Gammaproteobacteria bacterium]CAB9544004.1 DNA repair protein RadA [Bathymodiolus brooksi thiotrophic gill symbiont]CAC9560987.1 DNA repair protein RadA [uncultured Gammaproteobacteria bacterium]CAC9949899.1 DNA repair protein RadA [uncultured Gammaproteobacteria bacterium]
MAKTKLEFVCRECGVAHPQWAGQCLECKAWNTLEEVVVSQVTASKPASLQDLPPSKVQRLSEIKTESKPRLTTGLTELDRTLGGGLVDGSVVLIGGDPGIGKSTLILQAMSVINKNNTALYVSGEESAQQVSDRAVRLGIKEDVLLLNETHLEKIIKLAKELQPKVIVIDSIQTMVTDGSASAPGSVTQVRDCAAQLTQYAKQTNTILFLIGHVTKGGALAGPRILEHMVDCVLYFEGDAGGRYRIIRAVKNRFGAVNEISVFAMCETGLQQVENPSAIFLSNQVKPSPGSMVMVTREATRPLMIEVQALVDQSNGNPKRVSVGLDQNRLALQLAILHKHGGIATFDQDVFVNVVGGIKVNETASDLVVMLTIMSSLRDRVIPNDWIAFGEVGLTGEVRPVYNAIERLAEAQKHGFKIAIIPKANIPKKPIKGLKVVPVEYLYQALQYMSENT